MQNQSLTTQQLLAIYWLESEPRHTDKHSIFEHLNFFVEDRLLKAPEAVIAKAVGHLDNDFIDGDIEHWVVYISFMGHPHAVWDFMIDAVKLAKTDDHLSRIACGLAETLLAHYGSLIPFFESRAREDQKFARMLTAAWRHRMCDDVWVRLRALQAEVDTPLPQMIPLEKGRDYMADQLKPEDRANPDKGPYVQYAQGCWVKRRKK